MKRKFQISDSGMKNLLTAKIKKLQIYEMKITHHYRPYQLSHKNDFQYSQTTFMSKSEFI